eukprot:1514945-Ditylum_brightwellii.AAC.1
MSGGAAFGDLERRESLKVEMSDLVDQLEFLNDILLCGVKTLGVRICEYVIRIVLFPVLLEGLLRHEDKDDVNSKNCKGDYDSPQRQKSGHLKHDKKKYPYEHPVYESDVISEDEATTQASLLFLSQFFLTLEYTPLLRMLAVALLHPLSPFEWNENEGGLHNHSTLMSPSLAASASDKSCEYILTPILNAIAQDQVYPTLRRH